MESKKTTPQTEVKPIRKFAIHIGLIVVLGVLGAVAAHFGLVIATRHNARCTVPEFKGLIITEAERMAQKSDLKIIINDSLYAPMYEGGMVLDQLPKAGVGVKPGRTIYVTINAFGDKMATIPYVAGRSLRQAKNMLEVAGFQIEKLVYRRDMAANYVLAQYCGKQQIEQGNTSEAVVGTGITLHVGMSDEEWSTNMPQLIGLTLAEAKSTIWESGLNVGKITMPKGVTIENRDEALVVKQGVSAGADVRFGTTISLVFSFDQSEIETQRKAAIKAAIEAEKLRAEKAEAEAKERISNAASEQTSTVESTVVEDSFFE